MRTILFDIGIHFAILIGIGLWWRFAARQRSMPCPPWLAWSLENGYMNAVASSAIILDRLEIAPNMHVLDIGCGSGRITIPAAEQVGPNGDVVAIKNPAASSGVFTQKAITASQHATADTPAPDL